MGDEPSWTACPSRIFAADKLLFGTRFLAIMAYEAVIHGAKGLFIYGQISASTPTPAYNLPTADSTDPDAFQRTLERNDWFWAQTKPVIRELSSSRRFFTLPDAAVAGGHPPPARRPSKC